MSQSLLEKFKDMSIREILIVTCAKLDSVEENVDRIGSNVDRIETRINKHSAEADQREAACMSRNDKISEEISDVRKICEKRADRSLGMMQYLAMFLVAVGGGQVKDLGKIVMNFFRGAQ